MKAKTLTSMGSLHPVLFFAVVYIVSLLAAVFICSSLFYSCNASQSDIVLEQPHKTIPVKPANAPTTIALR